MWRDSQYSEEVEHSGIGDAVNGIMWRQQYHNDDNEFGVENKQPCEHSTDNSTDILHEPQSIALGPRHAEPMPEHTAVYLCYVVSDHIISSRHSGITRHVISQRIMD